MILKTTKRKGHNDFETTEIIRKIKAQITKDHYEQFFRRLRIDKIIIKINFIYIYIHAKFLFVLSTFYDFLYGQYKKY